ncbi:putative phosphoglucomutase 3 [Emiliania huxleyi CCMP1516]|uniref:phosphoacetylglucosamine mutase n=2 Tax=Emiliania huxleyi TaxID=2903 RepID=A0A0D3IZL8_EMIH1|nr:putative phosphoglucomutase 3 [Emiliania huxleyi CCMP1516]EOD16703.1 putative phosphoglucomutase 3 [Emiliania huxleyi CCMP1516]|eukprot:XP_005769132.1 putative phosphoglucomutase 3 [Emiliania huxleyi CCMP1516]
MIGPPHPGVPLAYGTAGFRARADLLDSTFFRMGALAVLRSRSRGGLAVGLMVTASHNAEPDNGIKLVDPDGGMLDVSWEPHASAVANAADADLAAALDAVADAVGVVSAGGGRVLVARDTRPHSERLSALALDGVSHLGGAGEDFGLLTTPQLHHIVRHANGGAAGGAHVGPAAWASEGGYAEMLCTAFAALLPPDLGGGGLRAPLTVDCACGVGGPQLAPIAQRLAPLLPLELINRPGEGELNAGCGAEFVQKGRLPPRGLDTPPPTTSADSGGGGGGGGSRLCSLDGDADRVDLAAAHSRGRAFVRPSGTEDVVRVYAEAATQQAADELARKVGQATWRLAGGVGEQP